LKIESKLLEHGQWIIRQDLEDDYDQESLLEERRISVRGECLEMIKSHQLSTKGFIMLDTLFFFSTPETDLFQIRGECVVMDFMYGSNVITDAQQFGCSEFSALDTHNIWYAPDYKAKYKMPAFEQINYLCIILSRDFYFNLISAGSELHHEFSKNIELRKPCYLSSAYLPFNPAIKWVIHEIRNSKRKGALQRMFIETKVRELLLLQLETLIENTVTTKVLTDDADFMKLLEAKQILEAEYTKAPTITELSRKISLNEFKLKKGFKAHFGNTIKGYIIKLRMEHAKGLFKSKATTVSEVAYKCGYKDVSHFSAAFKTFYGFSPQKFKINWNATNLILYWLFLAGL
jgi:AraC-like DNA-binding protein